ncbi:YjgN family protein [Phenylobacterium aquaticum]|uniref:YjgN family protein n=1 Tax=Phenylobacterium aquaticum TaxID=1763816 RepID=UPI0026EE6CA2|nr:DUF898 family protein [Phenylobacterium aquaticum]
MFNSDNPTPEGVETLTFAQKVRLGSFLGLSVKNGLLNLVTLTLYRFWGRTEVRRRLWQAIYLNDEPFEYTGRGGELFRGFLYAMLLVGLPLLVVVAGAQFLGPKFAALIIFPIYLFLFVLFGFARFSAFRYLASRTLWRGVRFQLKGSRIRYGFSYLGYLLLSVITLGWFWPAAERRLAGPLWDGLRFGDRRFRFSLDAARKIPIYRAFIPAALVFGVLYFAVMGVIFAIRFAAQKAQPAAPDGAMIVLIYAMLLPLSVLGVLIFAPYQAARLRSVVAGISLEDARFRLEVKWWGMAMLELGNLLLLIISLGLLFPVVEARTARFLISRLKSTGTADLASAVQAPRGPGTGEGLADAFGAINL